MNLRNLMIVITLLLTATSTPASAWFYKDTFKVVQENSLPNQLGTFRHIEFDLPSQSDEIHFYTINLQDNYKAKFYLQEAAAHVDAQFINQLMEKQNAFIAINGGFYTAKFKPVGLYIDNGQRTQRFVRHRLLTACLAIDEKQKFTIFSGNSTACLQAQNAIQAGPLVIDNGGVNPKLHYDNQKSGVTNEFLGPHRRTLIAETIDNKMILMITTPATLESIANLLTTHPDAFGVTKFKSVLNLDGGRSTGMFIRYPTLPFYSQEISPVKNLILIN